MSDNNFYSDDSTDKMPPREPSQPNQQGKLIIGGFQNSPNRPDRKPYQYTPQSSSPEQQAEPPIAYPQRQGFPANSGQPIANQQRQAGSSYPYQGQPAQPAMRVSPGSPGSYPAPQPGQMPGSPAPAPRVPRKKEKRPLRKR